MIDSHYNYYCVLYLYLREFVYHSYYCFVIVAFRNVVNNVLINAYANWKNKLATHHDVLHTQVKRVNRMLQVN